MESRSSSVQRRWGQEQDPSKLTSYLQRERVAWEQWQPSVSRETEHWLLLRPWRATAPSPGALFTVLQCFFLVVVFLTQSNSSSTWNMTTRGLWDIKGNWAVVGCILHLVRARGQDRESMTGSLMMPGTMMDWRWKSQPTKRDTRGWRARGSWDCQWHNPKQWQSQLIAANSGDRALQWHREWQRRQGARVTLMIRRQMVTATQRQSQAETDATVPSVWAVCPRCHSTRLQSAAQTTVCCVHSSWYFKHFLQITIF